MRIICFITGGTGAFSVCDGHAGDRDDSSILWDVVDDDGLGHREDDDDLVGTASATKVIRTCGDVDVKCIRVL